MNTSSQKIALGVGLAAAAILGSGLVVVEPGEVAVVRRLGRLLDPVWAPGLHWRIPLGVDRLDRVRPAAVRSLAIGGGPRASAGRQPGAGEVMTGDLNLLQIQATVQYRVAQPVDFVLSAQGVDPLLERLADAAVARTLAARGVDDALRLERHEIARLVERLLQADVQRLRLGLQILSVGFGDVRPPAEVEADFAAAQAALSEREARISQAGGIASTRVTEAQAARYAIGQRAQAQAIAIKQNAQARADRFVRLAAEAKHSRPLVFRRLYIETMATILDQVKTKIVAPADESVDVTLFGDPTPAEKPGPSPR